MELCALLVRPNLDILGTVRSAFPEKFGTPRQGCLSPHSSGYIEIVKEWEPVKCLQGLDGFSHAWMIFWFHGNTNLAYRPIISPPRAPHLRVGALASRSPLRPNPIGLTLVKIDRVVDDRVYISGIDVIDGTPVLDIKPYIHAYDSVPASTAGWMESLETLALAVTFSDAALQHLRALNHPTLKTAIEDILRTDIRNRNDKQAKNAGKRLGFYYEDFNIVFQVVDQEALVLAIEPRGPGDAKNLGEECKSRSTENGHHLRATTTASDP